MNSFKAAAVLFLSTTVSAIAADLPSLKSGSVNPPAPIWAGFYAGLNVGGIWGNANSVNVTTMPISGSEASDPTLDFTKTALGGASEHWRNLHGNDERIYRRRTTRL